MVMINTIKIIFQMKAATSANSFLYFLRRLWLVGRFVDEDLYKDGTLKNAFAMAVAVLVQIKNLFAKILYFLLLIALPVFAAESIDPELKGQSVALFIHVLFFVNCLLGSLVDSRIFTVTQDKILCIKYMHMDPARYVKASLLMKYVPFFIYYLIVLSISFILTGGSFFQAVIFCFSYICFRLMGEALQLYIYDKWNFVFSRKVLLVLPIILLGLAAAYVPMFTAYSFLITPILLHPAIIVIYAIVGGISLYYIALGYKGYREKLPRSIDLKYSYNYSKEQAKQNSFKDVAIKDSDLLHTGREDISSNSSLSGYSYLNAVFFQRHRRQLSKALYYRLASVAAALLFGIIFYYIQPELAVSVSTKLTGQVPLFVFIMYILTTANKACRAMFYNCDISLLRYGFYRKPQTILSNFRIRLMRISLDNILIGLAICLSTVIFLQICGTDWLNTGMLLFTLSILVLSVFFTVHHLFLYYVFQPYTTDLNIKNPFFQVLNGAIYFLSYVCFMIKAGNLTFTIVILLFTLLYTGIAVLTIYKFAPKHFRVK